MEIGLRTLGAQNLHQDYLAIQTTFPEVDRLCLCVLADYACLRGLPRPNYN